MALISSIVTQLPTKTDIRPSMEVLDDDHVLVDYSNSFNIPDFSKIRTVSVLNYVTGLSYGNATREDYSGALKVVQKLVQNAKLMTKVNPCTTHRFCVRLTFDEAPTYVDSLVNEYVPGPMDHVSMKHYLDYNIPVSCMFRSPKTFCMKRKIMIAAHFQL